MAAAVGCDPGAPILPVLTLPDELVVIGRTPLGGRYPHAAPTLAVAAGELAELAFASRITLDTRYAQVIDATPVGDLALDSTLAQLRGKPRYKLHSWFRLQHGVAYQWRLDRLAHAGVLQVQTTKTLGLFTRHRYLPDVVARTALLTRVWHVLRGWREPDPRTVSLAAILHGSHLDRSLFTERQDRRALKHLGRHDVLATSLRTLLESSSAAAAAGGVAAAGAGGV